MEALRRIISLDRLRGTLDIPSTFGYKKVEVLILPVDSHAIEGKKEAFEPENFYGVSRIENIDQALQEMHDEWD